MPQIDFYILHNTLTFLDRDRFVCRLTDKVWHQGYRLYLHTGGIAQAKVLDDLLWTFRQESFLPHDISSEASSMAPIQIGYMEQHVNPLDVLVNLTEAVPDFFEQFKRIVEIVMDVPQAREIGRQRYRFYKERGNPLNTHDIQG